MKSITDSGIFEGYASVFNVVDKVQDVILPGAFKDNLRVDEIKLLWQHNHDSPIGKILDIYEDTNGLYVKAQLILDVRQASEAYYLLKSGVINGLSIGYIVLSHAERLNCGVKKIEKVDLWEISLVTFPANKFATIISCKSLFLAITRACNSIDNLICK